MRLWGSDSLPVTPAERARRRTIILIALVGFLALSGSYSAGMARGIYHAERIANTADGFRVALDECLEISRQSMAFITTRDDRLADELERRTRLWSADR